MRKYLLFLFLLIASLLSAEYVEKTEAIKMLQQAKADDYPDCNEVYISNEIVVLDEHCRGDEITESYRKILTDGAKKDNAVTFWYDMDYGDIDISAIELIKASGEIIVFNPDEILQEKDNSYMGWSNIYSESSKILTAEIPNMEVGDIIFTKQKNIIKKATMEENYFNSFYVETYTKYINDYLEINIPASKKLYIHELNKSDFPVDFSRIEKDGVVTYKWTTQNNPLIIYEPNMDNSDFYAHLIKMTTVESWEDISRWYYNIVAPHMKVNEAIKNKVLELTEGITSRQEKAAKLFYWAAHSVRYLGVDKEKNRPGFEPHDVTYTFETRGGVCRDKAALLTAMLREAGIGSDVILISSGSRLNFEAPMLWFNHAITVSYDENGEPEFIFDPTDENTKDFLPKYEEDNSYLIASKKGVTLKTIPISDPLKNNSTVKIQLRIDENNNATGTIEYFFSGFSDTVIRSRLSRLNRYEFDKTVSGFISSLHPNCQLISFDFVDPANKEENLKITAQIKIDDYISTFGKNIFIPFEPSRLNLNMVYNWMMMPFDLSERKYDFQLMGAFSFDIDYEIEFSEKLENPSIPKLELLDFEGFETTLSIKHNDNKMMFNYHFENNNIHFKQKQFEEIKQRLANLTKYENLYIIAEIGGEND
ncbi:MAG: transglutaminase domain-containing protein [Candidatus Cloacimonadales bacterium]|nr:transglutaminase domain-containing protein [Candidatus Cloacimonadales bacterium]